MIFSLWSTDIVRYKQYGILPVLISPATISAVDDNLTNVPWPFLTISDEIIFLDGGRIIERGDHDVLMQKNGEYAALFEKQMLEELEA